MAEPALWKQKHVAVGDEKEAEKLVQCLSLVYRKCGCMVKLGMVGGMVGFLGDETPKA